MDDVYSQLFSISRGIPEPDLDGIIKRRDDDLYELYKERTNPKGIDPFAPPIRMADVPYTLPTQRSPYLIDKNLYWMDSPIKRDYSPSELLNLMNTRYRV